MTCPRSSICPILIRYRTRLYSNIGPCLAPATFPFSNTGLYSDPGPVLSLVLILFLFLVPSLLYYLSFLGPSYLKHTHVGCI